MTTQTTPQNAGAPQQSATAAPHLQATDDITERKPLMTGGNILMMNLGFFGIQFSFGLTQTAMSPLFSAMGAEAHDLPILNLAGPMTGLLIQPLIGALSDRTWSDRWGRRKPYVLIGALLCIVLLVAFPYISVLWLAVLGLWLLDAGNNTSMEPYRALIADRLPKSQLARGFLVQSMFTGGGAVLSNFSIFAFQKVLPGLAANGIPYWAYVCFWLGAVCILVTVGVAMRSTRELTPPAEDLEEIRNSPQGPAAIVRDIATAVKVMPIAMHKIGLVFVFQWYAMFIYWQFVSLSVGESVFQVDPENQEAFQQAAGWSGLLNGSYNLVTMISALLMLRFVMRFGGRAVHAVSLLIGGASIFWLAHIESQALSVIPMIGIGIMWASMVGVPYLMVASMVPARRSGVYMGILNMMIVVPMLVETLSFGWILENVLGGKAVNALMLAGVLLGIGALAMLWVKTPSEADESTIVPLGAPDGTISAYDRVIVGADGTDNTMYGLDRAMDIAASANARLMIVTCYNPGPESSQAEGQHRELYGEEAGRQALRRAVDHLNRFRVRAYDSVLIPGDIADGLLSASRGDRRNLIVVGNRGLGAEDGVLGSIPAKVVKNAVSDVIVVQTSDISDDSRLAAKG